MESIVIIYEKPTIIIISEISAAVRSITEIPYYYTHDITVDGFYVTWPTRVLKNTNNK